MRQPPTVPSTILVAEDDPDDQVLLRDSFREAGFTGPIEFVDSGTALLESLKDRQRRLPSLSHDGPLLVMLDMNMPGMGGYEVLLHIKSDPELRRIPAIVLTTSRDRTDMLTAYDLGASSFLTKPNEYDDMVELARGVCRYWFGTVKLP